MHLIKKCWAQFISSQIKHFVVPFLEPDNFKLKAKKYVVDGIWTLLLGMINLATQQRPWLLKRQVLLAHEVIG